jgi:hypothetical protein
MPEMQREQPVRLCDQHARSRPAAYERSTNTTEEKKLPFANH